MTNMRGDPNAVTLSLSIERKRESLPRFVVVPAPLLEGLRLAGTTVVEATINGVAVGRRTIKRWDEDRWFLELTNPICHRVGVETGDQVELSLQLVGDELPAELEELITNDQDMAAAWDAMSPSRQRMLREDVFAAKSPETRRRRAQRGLGATGNP